MTTPTPGPGPAPVTPVVPVAPPAPATSEPAAPAVQPAEPQSAFKPNEGGYDWKRHEQLFGPPGEKTPAAPPPAEPPKPVETAPAVAPTETPAVASEAKPEADKFGAEVLDQIKAEFRAEYPSADEALIARLADKELYVRKLQSESTKKSKEITKLLNRTLRPEIKPPAMTPFEQSLQSAPAQPGAVPTPPPVVSPPPAPPVQPPAPAEPAMPEYMRSFDAAMEEYNTAILAGDSRHAAEVLAQINAVEYSIRQKAILEEVNRIVDERLKPIQKTTEEIESKRQAEEDTEFALAEVEKVNPEIRSMFEPVSNEPLVVNGKQYHDTLMNRIALRFPHINRINVSHPDPRTASRLTMIERCKAAAEMMSLIGAEPGETAPQPPAVPAPVQPALATPPTGTPVPMTPEVIAHAARLIAERELADRARHGLNAGPGGSSISQPATQSFLDQIRAGQHPMDRIASLRR